MPTLSMDLSGQLTFMNVAVILMMSQLSQWLLQQVMSQLLHLDVLHSQLDVLNAPGSTRQEFQAYFNPRNLGPGDLEELSPELWEEFRPDGAVSMICTCKIWQMKRPKVLNQTLIDPQGYLRPQLQTYPEPLCQVWKLKTLNCTGISSLNFRL